MEELTKTQIVLLTLLVSFVTSIATGIITVSLMDQASVGVTQTVNRVVERTIERVVPEKGQSAGVITKEVIVKEENLITESIEKGSQSVLRIKKIPVGANATTTPTVSFGTVVSRDGLIIADGASLSANETYDGITENGQRVGLSVIKIKNGVAFLKPHQEEDVSLTPAKISDSDKVKLGQTSIMITGHDRNTVSTGIISGIRKSEEGDIVAFDSNLAGGNIYANAVLNLSGEVVGIRLSSTANQPDYLLATNLLKSWIDEIGTE